MKKKARMERRRGLTRRGFGAGALGGLALALVKPIKRIRAAAPVSAREADYYEPCDERIPKAQRR